MTLLAIESSCDETSAAVLRDGKILSNIIASQDEHIRYGGVVPELASRAHIAKITDVVALALSRAETGMDEIETVAATCGPGLIGSLLVGLTFAKGIALSRKLPFYGINHLEGHLFSACLENPDLKPPFLSLIVSGGHTLLVQVEAIGRYRILGQTRDDAAGEAFDKVAKILGLPYPGGPEIETLAEKGDAAAVTFPVASLKTDAPDFSFSGLKTAVLYHYRQLAAPVPEAQKANIAAAFQDAVVRALAGNLETAMQQTKAKRITLAGGVAQNETLRSRLQRLAESAGCAFFSPRAEYCTDNAAMIAYAAFLRSGTFPPSPLTTGATPNLPLL